MTVADICEIRIYDSALNWVDVCATAESVRFDRELSGAGAFEIHVHPEKNGALTLATRGNIIVINSMPELSGIVRSFSVSESRDKAEFVVFGETCASLLRQRVIVPPTQTQEPTAQGWDRFSGDTESVIKHYILAQVVSPYDDNRAIPILTVADNQNRGQPLTWQARFSVLLDEITDISQFAGAGFHVTTDIANKRLIFETIFGTDRSKNQDAVSPVSFNMEYQNVDEYSYSEDYTTFATTGYAGGAGENENRLILPLGGDYTGLERFESFLDCANAKNVTELQTLSQKKLSELAPVKNVEASALPRAYAFGKDYFLGDLVTLYISRLELDISTPVTAVSEVWERQSGHKTEIRFGERLPNIFTAKLRKDLVM